MTDRDEHPSLCILNTGPAVPEMLLGRGVKRAGGAELQLADIARKLAARDWRVSFAFYDYGDFEPRAAVNGIELVASPPPMGGPPGIRFLTRTLPASRGLLRHTSAEVYLQMGAGWQNALLARWCRSAERRFVLWMASITDPFCDDRRRSRLPVHERWMARYGLRHADVLVAQTVDQQKALRARHGRESVLIRNIFVPAQKTTVPPNEPPVVFWAATVREVKRPHLFLDIAEALPEISFVMAGGPADGDTGLFAEVRARAESIDNVNFLGFVPFREIDKHYRQASVYLCTSSVEGFSNSILQAWSHGRPVVSTLDPDGVIEQYDLGFHATTTKDLVSAIHRACANSADYIIPARTYLQENHAPEIIMPQIEAALRGETPPD